MGKDICTAICLAGGSGSRMQSNVAKQYMLINGKPLIWYALSTFQKSRIIDDVVLVTRPDDLEYMKTEIVDRYGFDKVSAIVSGGAERYLSVLNGLKSIRQVEDDNSFVFIHDGARPFVTEKIIEDTYEAAKESGACVAAVLSKDTIKISDGNGFVASTPDRSLVWNIQTPQVFRGKLIYDAYCMLEKKLDELKSQGIAITDDAGVVELFSATKVRLVNASYENIKITTPEDISVAESILKKQLG